MALSSYAVHEYCQVNENVDAIFKENTQKKEGRGHYSSFGYTYSHI